jgi:hypothetical protein
LQVAATYGQLRLTPKTLAKVLRLVSDNIADKDYESPFPVLEGEELPPEWGLPHDPRH